MARKFFKTVFTVTVLSEDTPYSYSSLSEIAYDTTDGGCSGEVEAAEMVELTGKEAADALIVQGSDPQFFQIDSEGKDIE